MMGSLLLVLIEAQILIPLVLNLPVLPMEGKQALFERYLLGQIDLDTYKSEKAAYDAEILKVKNSYAAVTAQAKLKREEQARQSSRQEIAHSITEADVLTSELTDLLIEKVYVFPDNRIEIVYKVHDLFE